MSSTAHEVLEPSLQPEPLRIGARHLVLLGLLAAIALGVAYFLPSALLVLAAAVMAWVLPSRSTAGGVRTRFVLASLAALLAAFVIRQWPAAAETTAGAQPAESPTLLSWLLGLPLAGAVAVLFLPRQAPGVLRATTLATMLA